MKTILVPLDGSAHANAVLAHIPPLARSLGARVRLLRVLPETYEGAPALHEVVHSYGVGDGLVIDEPRPLTFDARRRAAADEHMSALINLRAAGLDAELEVAAGHPADAIVEMAATTGASLIAMATHGWGGLRRWVLGSVTDKVIHAAPAPVYVVRGGPEMGTAPALRRILVPLDGSALALKALPMAVELAEASGACLKLLRVITPPMLLGYPDSYMSSELAQSYAVPDEELRARALADLQMVAEQVVARHGVTATIEVHSGLPADEIVDTAERRDADLVVMATHGRSGLRRWALGSVADKVLHACARPLLLVRAGELEA